MKNRLISLALLCIAGLAFAEGTPASPAAGNETASSPTPPRAHAKPPKRKLARMPQGDMRHCLDQDSNLAIIRCAEKPGLKKP